MVPREGNGRLRKGKVRTTGRGLGILASMPKKSNHPEAKTKQKEILHGRHPPHSLNHTRVV